MNFISKPVIALATAAVIGASMMSPVMAASNTRLHQMRTAPMAQQQMPADAYNQYGSGNAYNQFGNGTPSEYLLNPANNFGQGNRCVTDEGYGRWSYCDTN
jgi:hypothetical protein